MTLKSTNPLRHYTGLLNAWLGNFKERPDYSAVQVEGENRWPMGKLDGTNIEKDFDKKIFCSVLSVPITVKGSCFFFTLMD